MPAAIRTKRHMYRLVERGCLGNYPRWWRTLQELKESGYQGSVSIRSLQVANPVRLYHVPAADVARTVAQLPPAQRESGLVFSESPADHHRTLQGEWDGLYLHYSYKPLPMRLAFAEESLYAMGPRARLLLRGHLDASDYDWLNELLEAYPGHVVEFSGFSVPVGQLQTRMLVWEVRAY